MIRSVTFTGQVEEQYLSLSVALPGAGTSLPRWGHWGFSPGSATRGRRSLQEFCSGSHPAASCSASSCGHSTGGDSSAHLALTALGARQVSSTGSSAAHTAQAVLSAEGHLGQTQGLSMQRAQGHPWAGVCALWSCRSSSNSEIHPVQASNSSRSNSSGLIIQEKCISAELLKAGVFPDGL